MKQFNQDNFILKYIFVRWSIIILMIALLILKSSLVMIFSIGCHLIALLVYRQEYWIWFKSIFNDLKNTKNDFLLSHPIILLFTKVVYAYTNIFIFGLLEVYSFTQAKKLSSINSQESK